MLVPAYISSALKLFLDFCFVAVSLFWLSKPTRQSKYHQLLSWSVMPLVLKFVRNCTEIHLSGGFFPLLAAGIAYTIKINEK